MKYFILPDSTLNTSIFSKHSSNNKKPLQVMFFKHHLSEIINKKYNVYYERRNGHAKKHQSKQRLYVQRYYIKPAVPPQERI